MTSDQANEQMPGARERVTRRHFLYGFGTAVATAASQSAVMEVLAPTVARAGSGADLVLSLLRPSDMLVLDIRCWNLRVNTSGGDPVLERINPAETASVAYVFPAQSLAEQVYFVMPPDPTPGNGETQLLLSGPTQLVFDWPANLASVGLTPQALLNWKPLLPRLVPAAQAGQGEIRPILQPGDKDTAIEAPWRMFLSPGPTGAWSHRPHKLQNGERVEIWHTRLGTLDGTKVVEPPDTTQPVRAVWTTGFQPFGDPAPDPGFPLSLNAKQRGNLVRVTTSGIDVLGLPFAGDPAEARLLLLSALGATTDIVGAWDKKWVSLEASRNRMSQGREHYVRVVEKGQLYPLGVRASRIIITERKFEHDTGWVAPLRQRELIVVRQPVKDYGGDFHRFSGRKFAFRRIRIETLTTPDLDQGLARQFIPSPPVDPNRDAFWVTSGGDDVRFAVVGTDWDGNEIGFDMATIFVPFETAYDATKTALIDADYLNPNIVPEARRTLEIAGQSVAYAPAGDKPGSTSAATQRIVLGSHQPVTSDNDTTPPSFDTLLLADQAGFFPTFEAADIEVPGLEALRAALPVSPPRIELTQEFLEKGFPSLTDIANDPALGLNPAEVFAKVQSSLPSLTLPGDAAGVALPNLDIAGLSRQLGPVGDALGDLIKPPDLNKNPPELPQFTPEQFLDKLNAKILGAIPVSDIIKALGFNPDDYKNDAKKLQSELDKLPRFPSELVYPNNDKTKPPTAVITRLKFKPGVKTSDIAPFEGFFQADYDNDNKTSLTLEAEFVTPFADPTATTYDIKGELANFRVNLFGLSADRQFIVITFDRVRFTASSKAKPSIDVKVAGVAFGQALKFVEEFAKFLASQSRIPGVEVSRQGVKASFSLSLPSLQVGVFGLSNISFSFGFNLPFDTGAARVRVGFASRESKFRLQVQFFGGGGFFGLALGVDGLELIEAALEFGAVAALDLGLASGSVSIMAGIYFKLENKNNQDVVELEGYLRAMGQVSVLGVVKVCLELYLGLRYVSPPGKAYGKASVKLSVQVFFFNVTVEATVEKQFGSSENDPTFADAVPTQALWDEYCDAFAV